MLRRVGDAVGHHAREIGLRDCVGARELAVAEHHVRLPLLHELHLAGEALEEGGGPHDRVAHVGLRRDRLLEPQLRALELEQRLLHADRREEHVVRAALRDQLVERVLRRAVVDLVGVLDAARPARQARDHHVDRLGEAARAQARRVGDVAERHLRAREVGDDLRAALLAADAALLARERRHLVPAAHQLLRHEAADVARRADHQHAHVRRRRRRHVDLAHRRGGGAQLGARGGRTAREERRRRHERRVRRRRGGN